MTDKTQMRVIVALLALDAALNIWLYRSSVKREREWREHG